MFLFCLLAPDLFIFWFAGNLKSLFSVQNSPFALLFCIAPCSLAKGIISFSRSFWEQIAASCYQTSGVLLCFEKEEKNNLLWAASLYSWSEMNSQMKGYISSVPCDTKSDLKSLLLVQSDSEAEEVTLCKTVYDTQRCCVLVLQIQSTPLVLELFLVWQKPHHNVWLFWITKLQHHRFWTLPDVCIHHTRCSKWNWVTDIVLCCGDELFLSLITTSAMEYTAVITHFHIPFVSSDIDLIFFWYTIFSLGLTLLLNKATLRFLYSKNNFYLKKSYIWRENSTHYLVLQDLIQLSISSR